MMYVWMQIMTAERLREVPVNYRWSDSNNQTSEGSNKQVVSQCAQLRRSKGM